MLSIQSIHLTTPVKKKRSFGVGSHGATSAVQDRHDFHSLLQEEVRIRDGGEERLTQENDRCQLLPHQMVELVFVCPYDYDSQIVVSVVSPGKTHRLRLPIARLPDIGQRLSDQVFPVPASSPRHDFLSEGHSSIQDATTSSYGCKPQPQRSRRYNKFWSFSYRTSPAKGPLFLRHFYGKIRLNNEFLVPYSWIMNTHHPQKSNQWKR